MFARPDPYVIISIISGALYLMLLTGMLILMRKRIANLVSVLRSRKRFARVRSISEKTFGLSAHLDEMLCTVMKRPVSATVFLSFMIGLFFLVFTVSAKNLPFGTAVIIGAAFALIPYLYMRVRLERLRRRGSYEGETLVAALLTQYWVANGNIFEAMELVISGGGDIRVTSRLLSALLLKIRSTGDAARIGTATDAFSYGVGTNWSRILAYNIKTAVISGGDIALALEDLLVQLREARTLSEERKRINGESVRIVVFLIPLLYMGSIFVSIGMLGITPAGFLRNQFFTAEGFGLFSIAVFLFLVNIFLIELVTNRKLDF
ncbi:MAG: hypothetical protein LBN36_04900 [Clostridiales Family XIII bacterium]|jgi:hypothetical protein|nr:hypothetical protein [Clostridiales Family XIII bacterium]